MTIAAYPLTEALFQTLPAASWQGLLAVERKWQQVQQGALVTPTIARELSQNLESPPDYHVIIAGGTLGIFIGAALARRGWRVLLLEKGIFEGRVQEWNISRPELEQLVTLHLLTPAELASVTISSFNPVRVSFSDHDLWVQDVLNLGVSPRRLLNLLREKFIAWGGQLLEQQGFEQVTIHPNGVQVHTQTAVFSGRLLIDSMGHFSPLVQQFRHGQKPDGICLVVGTCAQGFADNSQADLMVSFTPTAKRCQYFWEAFPAQDGRTTYLFTYLQAQPGALSLCALFEDYARLLPEYQHTTLDQLTIQRALYGFFPSYEQPLKIPFDRILAIGDAAGLQSPLSFGGFGALLRHLPRWDAGLDLILQTDHCDRATLAQIQPYQPNLAVTWLFQRAMSVPSHAQTFPPERINRLLTTVFAQMEQLGLPVLLPFLRDVVQFGGLSQTMVKTALADPQLILEIVQQVGVPQTLAWLRHFLVLGCYTGLVHLSDPVAPQIQKFLQQYPPHWQLAWLSQRQAWLWGSGLE